MRHDVTYELGLDDGRVLLTRVCRPVDTTTYGRQLWSAILRDQLDVDEDTFWACVEGTVLPQRGSSAPEASASVLPASLVHQLIHDAGVPEAEVATMSLADAVDAMTAHWSRPRNR